MDNSNAIIDKNTMTIENTKFCGAKIPSDAVICASCGRQVEAFNGTIQQSAAMPNIVINNANIYSNVNANGMIGPGSRMRNKWIVLILCILLGCFGGHKFYEGKAGMGILYIFTFGLFGIGLLSILLPSF